MLSMLWKPAFADVVFLPRWTDILPAVLIAAVVLLAAGLLIYFAVRARKRRKNRNAEKEERK